MIMQSLRVVEADRCTRLDDIPIGSSFAQPRATRVASYTQQRNPDAASTYADNPKAWGQSLELLSKEVKPWCNSSS
jgi:hypothetical protein